jgi:hypothetical protein
MINKNLPIPLSQDINYGLFTEISKGLNYALGDSTGRSISRRTTHGLQSMLNIEDFDDALVEHVVHGSMFLSAALVTSENKNSNIFGWLIIVFLIICYWNGKSSPIKLSLDTVPPPKLIY